MTILEDIYQGRTLVYGHRGASAYAPMNTIPAFELAAEQGADGIELDVWLTGDRSQLIILHDATVDHTTDGTGFVYEKSFDELRELDASYKFPQYRGVQLPTLDEVFEVVGQKLIVNVEIKADFNMQPGTEQAVADCLARHGMERRVIVSSFSAEVLKRFRVANQITPIGFLYAIQTPPSEWELIQTIPHEARHPHHLFIDAAMMADANRDGYLVNTWTVNEPQRARDLSALGVRGIITDAPDTILHALRGA